MQEQPGFQLPYQVVHYSDQLRLFHKYTQLQVRRYENLAYLCCGLVRSQSSFRERSILL
jgi:hypothetical protein